MAGEAGWALFPHGIGPKLIHTTIEEQPTFLACHRLELCSYIQPLAKELLARLSLWTRCNPAT